jgi:hypothetical protein
MTLPVVNDIPKYTMKLPSSGKSMSYRPFLVKEQKVLLIALESQDSEAILQSIVDCIAACVDGIDLNRLTTFDIEYLFTQIRSKSVGETTKVKLKCGCLEYTEVDVNLADVGIDVPKDNNRIELTDKFALSLRYPNYKQLMLVSESTATDDASVTGNLVQSIKMVLDTLQTPDELIRFDDYQDAEIDTFIDNLTAGQFEEIMKFIHNIPKLQHEIEYKCASCGVDNKVTLEGLQDFF